MTRGLALDTPPGVLRTQLRVVAFYFLLGLVVWFLSAVLNYFSSCDGGFWALLAAYPPCQNLFVHSVILACFLFFGLLMSRAEVRREQAQTEIRRLNEELSQRVALRTTELAHTSDALQQCITEHQRAEEAVGLSEERLQLLVENVNAVLCSMNADGIVTYISPAAQRLFGFPVDEIIGHSYLLLAHPEDRPSFERHFHNVFRGADVSVELRVLTRSGDVRWMRASCRPLRDGDRIVGGQGLLLDVTERKEAEDQREKLLFGLTAVIRAANRLMQCDSADTLLRAAVDLARGQLGVERCSIFVRDGQTVRGAYGTDLYGRTTDERAIVSPFDEHWENVFSATQEVAPRWWVKQTPLTNWDGTKGIQLGLGWVAHTAIGLHGQRPTAVFCNDTAISGRPLDAAQQQVISLYCSFLASVLERKRAEQQMEKLISGLRAVVKAADRLIACDTLDELYRRAVEVARAVLGFERCAIFVKDGENIRGTYGTNLRGETTDERSRLWAEDRGDWDAIFAAVRDRDPHWWRKETVLTEWSGNEAKPAGPGWVCYTAIAQAGAKPIGIFCNDTGISRKPMDTTQQEILGVYCSFLADMIERKRIEEALRTATEKAEIANRLKSQILANVSHEVRTPLNSIIGFTEQILESESLGTIRGHARTVLREGLGLLSIINTILEHARIEAGTLELQCRPLDLRHLVESAAGLARAGARDKGLSFGTSVAQGVPAYVIGDAQRLHQVLTNLLDNAVKFTRRGSVSLIVETAVAPSDTVDLRFSVTDTGIGIPDDKQQVIFESFTQADGSTTRPYRGVGLGLTIAQQLVRLMGGEMGLSSVPRKGSTFWFTVSLKVSPSPPEPEELVLLPEGHPALAEAPVAPAHILLAEDYPANREITRLVLESAGHKVDVVTDGAEAVAACERDVFDLILLDVHMPGMDGLDAARRIRAGASACARAPILALTASADPETRETCRKAGMSGIITKPIRRDPFIATVGRWVSGNKGPSETESGTTRPVGEDNDAGPPARFDYEQAVREFGGNRALANRVIADFLHTAQGQLSLLREALGRGDARVLNREAHRIRGAAANLTAMALAEAARQLEALAASDSLSGAEDRVKEIEEEFAGLKQSFASVRRNGHKQRQREGG